jgi:hypothetical protein
MIWSWFLKGEKSHPQDIKEIELSDLLNSTPSRVEELRDVKRLLSHLC